MHSLNFDTNLLRKAKRKSVTQSEQTVTTISLVLGESVQDKTTLVCIFHHFSFRKLTHQFSVIIRFYVRENGSKILTFYRKIKLKSVRLVLFYCQSVSIADIQKMSSPILDYLSNSIMA